MYQTLYRKWRPKTFSDVVGQDHVTAVLRYEIEKKQTAHAYLFCGSRGTGKTTCAKILAKALNCENPQNGDPCGTCQSCRGIESGNIIDVIEMDAASNNGVDDIREIRESVDFVPAETKKRVYIIDEVHMLSQSAFNALLKTLEEPPEHVVFILATTELQKIPATILSRCQRFDFRRIDAAVIVERLKKIAQAEQIQINDAALYLIARAANGGMRDAIGMLEVCGAGGLGGELITEKRAAELIGVSDTDTMEQLLRAVLSSDFEEIFAICDTVFRGALDAEAFWTNFMGFYRDLFVIRMAKHPENYLDLPQSRLAELAELAKPFSKEQLLAHFSILDDTLAALQTNRTSKRVAVETGLIKLSDRRLGTDSASLLSRIAAIEDKLASGIPMAAQSAPKASETEAEKPSAATQTEAPRAQTQQVPKAMAAQTMRKYVNWPEVVAQCGDIPGVAAMLRSCHAFTDEKKRAWKIYVPDRITMSIIGAPQAMQHLLGALRAQSENPALDAQNIEFCTDALPREADAFDELTEEKSNAERNDKV